MNYRLFSVAEEDLSQAARFYEQQAEGLGLEFLDEFEDTAERICRSPEVWRRVSARHHRCLLRRFPFAVLYTLEEAGVLISGVMDLRRDPAVLSQRLEET